VIKCRPPGNRDPLPEEIEACKPFLDKQIEIISPQMIVTLGRFSMERYFQGAKISQIHGQPRRIGGIIYYPMYHPAAALHQPKWRQVVKADMSKIPQLLAQADSIAEVELPEDAEQLSLF
jgi:uracil-DNA glycosylase family 4